MKISTRGLALIPLIIASALLAIGLVAYQISLDSNRKAATRSRDAQYAEAHLAELMEYFASLSRQRLINYLNANPTFTLCTPINQIDRSASTDSTVAYVGDISSPLAALTESPLERVQKRLTVNRSFVFEKRVKNNLALVNSACGFALGPLAATWDWTTHGIMATVTVSWVPNLSTDPKSVSASLLLPGEGL